MSVAVYISRGCDVVMRDTGGYESVVDCKRTPAQAMKAAIKYQERENKAAQKALRSQKGRK